MYVNHDRYIEYMYSCLIGTLCHERNGSMISIITMYHDFKLSDLMHVVCNEYLYISLVRLVQMHTP